MVLFVIKQEFSLYLEKSFIHTQKVYCKFLLLWRVLLWIQCALACSMHMYAWPREVLSLKLHCLACASNGGLTNFFPTYRESQNCNVQSRFFHAFFKSIPEEFPYSALYPNQICKACVSSVKSFHCAEQCHHNLCVVLDQPWPEMPTISPHHEQDRDTTARERQPGVCHRQNHLGLGK